MCPCPLLNGTRTSACVAQLKMQSMGTLLHIRWGWHVFNWPLGCPVGSMRMSVACVAEENTMGGDRCIGCI